MILVLVYLGTFWLSGGNVFATVGAVLLAWIFIGASRGT